MPIPALDPNSNVLPPRLEFDGNVSAVSPYRCTMLELCDRFATTPMRVRILDGFLGFRAECRARRIVGFQWLAGSFLEGIEAIEDRDPNDIDVVTFVREPEAPADVATVLSRPTNLKSRDDVKSVYCVDSVFVPLRTPPSGLVSATRYWYSLYSHRRDKTWKGMLVVDLASGDEDDDRARTILEGRS